MIRRAYVGAVSVLALLARAGVGHALSLRSSAAETFLGDFAPGSSAVYSQATGSRLHLENPGSQLLRVGVAVVLPPSGDLQDGFEPWPSPGRIRLELSSADIRPGDAAQVEVAVDVPRDPSLSGGQYQFDVRATASDLAGSSLTLKTRVLLSVGAPLAEAGDIPAEGRAERPGFSLAPASAALERVALQSRGSGAQEWTTVKIVNAGDEDLTVTLTPARSWDDRDLVPKDQALGPNPRWLALAPAVVKIPAGAIGSARIGVAVPLERRYAAKRWTFVAAVDAAAGGKRTRRYFLLHVSTRDWTEEHKQ
jgi:hypothetical protein